MKKNQLYIPLVLIACVLYMPHSHALFGKKKEKQMNVKNEDDVPLTEDLMREHGILNRVLLIYDEIIRRLESNTAFPLSTLENALTIIKSFIEEYHEKLEEEYIFPLFEKHKKEVALV